MNASRARRKNHVEFVQLVCPFTDSYYDGVSSLRFLAIGLCLLMMLLMTGCYSHIGMTKIPPNSNNIIPRARSMLLPAAYLISIQVIRNGTPSNVNPAFERRFIGRLQEAGVFSDVISTVGRGRKLEGPHFDLVLHISETDHPHTLSNAIKEIFIGLSIYLLTPVLPLHYEYEEEMTLTVRLPNLTKKEYKAVARGSIYATWDRLGGVAYCKLTGKTVERCIISIVNQLVNDRWLYTSEVSL